MKPIDAHEAKGEKSTAGTPACDEPGNAQRKRLGFMNGQFKVPEDFDGLGQDEIADMFGG